MTSGGDMTRAVRSAGKRLKPAVAAGAIGAAALVGLCGPHPALAQSGSVTVTVTLSVTATATVDTAKVQTATQAAIQGLMGARARFLTSNGPDTTRIHDRLSGGTLTGGGTDPATGFAGGDEQKPATNARAGSAPGFGFAGGNGGSRAAGFAGSGILDSGQGTGPLSRFGLQAGRRAIPPMESDEPRDFAEEFPFNRDASSALTGSRNGPMPFRLSGSAEEGTGRFAFATSLSQMRAAAEAKEREKLALAGPAGAARDGEALPSGPVPLGLSGAASLQRPPSKPAAVDVWLEGASAYFTNETADGRRRGHASVVYAGADIILMPGLLVGVMGQVDWMADSGAGTGSATAVSGSLARDGRGWMAGPYLAARLTPHLYFDARAAWGRSMNHVDPLGAYVDEFGATRMLAAAKLTGDWSFGNLRLRPGAEAIWFRETSDAYVNVIGIAIDKQRYDLGRLTFGPEVGYRIGLGPASAIEPFIGLKGVWDFARTTETTAAGEPVSADAVHGRVEAGASFTNGDGVSVRASGQYEGLGSSTGYRAVQGRAQVVVPLQ